MSTCLLPVNLHTHTARCHHASGTEREYVEAALAAGMTTLGFSDHVPVPFPSGYTSRVRMTVGQTRGYVEALLELRDEYAGRIEILIGYEAEYYPDLFDAMMANITQYPLDFVVLGQHFSRNEFDGRYVADPCGDRAAFAAYTDQVIAGMRTGVFSYLAHPDLFHYVGEDADEVITVEARRICEAARETGMPLELNLLGIAAGRHYPDERFWRVAGEMGLPVVLASDAHSPGAVYREEATRAALSLAARCHLQVLDRPPLRAPWK